MSTNVAFNDLAAVVGFEPALRASKARVLPNYTKPLWQVRYESNVHSWFWRPQFYH